MLIKKRVCIYVYIFNNGSSLVSMKYSAHLWNVFVWKCAQPILIAETFKHVFTLKTKTFANFVVRYLKGVEDFTLASSSERETL